MIIYLEPLDSSGPVGEDIRAEVIAQHLSEENNVQTLDADVSVSLDLLNTLHKAGRLWLKSTSKNTDLTIDVYYVPGPKVIETISQEHNPWAAALGTKIRKSVRSTDGAIFKFPSENGTSSVDVFITDWSPCPAACALAVHRLHPILSECPDIPLSESHFTGKYVRHPLTGDLLPIWTADWVKADFGTGAVLVNPAHNETDLSFGRKMGLPIRFALSPEESSDEPDSWLVPPVIKTGHVVRSGQYDGMTRNEAQTTYFEVLKKRGLAHSYIDRSLGSAPIATLRLSETGPLALFQNGKLIDTAQADPKNRIIVEFSSAYKCADRAVKHRAQTVVANVGAMKKVGPVLAGMLIDAGVDPTIVNFINTGPVNGDLTDITDQTLRTALLVGGKISEPINLNQGLIDQVESFFKSQERCRSELSGGDAHPPSDIALFLSQGDPKNAFRSLARWQKECLKSGRKIDIGQLEVLCNRFTFCSTSAS
jgi:leucyl-tRNA synthetase